MLEFKFGTIFPAVAMFEVERGLEGRADCDPDSASGESSDSDCDREVKLPLLELIFGTIFPEVPIVEVERGLAGRADCEPDSAGGESTSGGEEVKFPLLEFKFGTIFPETPVVEVERVLVGRAGCDPVSAAEGFGDTSAFGGEEVKLPLLELKFGVIFPPNAAPEVDLGLVGGVGVPVLDT